MNQLYRITVNIFFGLLVAISLPALGNDIFTNEDVFPFQSFIWRGQSVTELAQLYQVMRQIERPADANALREAIEKTNLDAAFYIGSALAEFRDPRERDKAEILFQVEHPIFGRMDEAERLTSAGQLLLGYLFGYDFTPAQIKQVRDLLLLLPPKSVHYVASRITSNHLRQTNEILKILQAEVSSCGSTLSAPASTKFN